MMRNTLNILFKILRRVGMLLSDFKSGVISRVLLYLNGIQHEGFRSYGIPYLSIASGGSCRIGANLTMNNSLRSNPIGRPQPCIIFVDKGASLVIGRNVGLSQTALICHLSIEIGNDVKIGGGVCIYDTDFHSLSPEFRRNTYSDFQNSIRKPVVIGDNAFIGAHSIILKGVNIGANAVVGCGSVVTKNIPDNEIWAGNPAKFIKKIDTDSIITDITEYAGIQ